MSAPTGFPVVLTAPRTLMAPYRLLFDGILACNQTTRTPRPLANALLMPRPRSDALRAPVAPLGLRRIEAALVRDGFGVDEVAVVAGHRLPDAVGPATRVIGLTVGDPLGLGMSTTTSAAITGGRPLTARAHTELLGRIEQAVGRSGSPAAIIAGGPGAWQLEQSASDSVDHIVTGCADGNAADVVRAVADGEAQPRVIAGRGAAAEDIPAVLGPTTMAAVETSRGCELGCSFCTLAHVPMEHLPESTITADICTNLNAGQRDVCLVSEDLFRYGAQGAAPDPAALIALLERLRRFDGLGMIQTDHANLLSVSQFSDDELRTVRRLMVGDTGQEMPWLNVGVETAAGELLRANGGGAKMGPCPDDEWAALASRELRRLITAGFFPLASLVVALPGETGEQVRRTREWAESLADERLAIFPVLYAPTDGSPALRGRDLSREQWTLIRACYRINFRWIPRMYADSQRAAGVPAARRLLMQALGRGQAAVWRAQLAIRTRGNR
ncbi:MAG: hypothetical protein R6V58_04570 [Planctomycetota bacterium]